MGQVRFFARDNKLAATALYDHLDTVFGEDGWPVALTEIDEAADIHEVSV